MKAIIFLAAIVLLLAVAVQGGKFIDWMGRIRGKAFRGGRKGGGSRDSIVGGVTGGKRPTKGDRMDQDAQQFIQQGGGDKDDFKQLRQQNMQGDLDKMF
jgi:hypothetical protein